MPHKDTDNRDSLDDRIDALLSRKDKVPSPDFAAQTVRRAQADATIDHLLERLPVKPRPDFATETVQRVLAEASSGKTTSTDNKITRPFQKLLAFPIWAQAGIGLAAACMVIAAALLYTSGPNNPQQTVATQHPAPSTPQHIPAVAAASESGFTEIDALEYQQLIELEKDLILLADLTEVREWQTIDQLTQ